ncbi:MAG: TetR/AcrR family transcriptional regulator [Candidatus Methylomirabilis sp.]
MGAESRVQRRMLATRERLVNCALALFAKNGIYQTTVEEITEAADVGKGTFYEHFPSKGAIIQHLLHVGFQELLSQCRNEVRLAATTKERLKRLLRAQFQFFEDRRDLLILFHQVRGLVKLQPDETRLLQKEYKDYIRFLSEQLGALLDRRRYSDSTLKQMAFAMAGFVTGYLSYLVITDAKDDEMRDLTVPFRIFLEGIGGNGRHD